MLKLLSAVTLGLSLLNEAAAAYANPRTCSGVCVNTHDPSIIRRDDGTYFRFSTGGGIAIHSALNLTGPWVYNGAVLPDGTKIKLWEGKMDTWAPSVHLVDGTYYLYYAAVRDQPFNGQNLAAIGLATSKTLDVNSWKDLGKIGIESNKSSKFNAIDPYLFVENGRNYMIFGSYYRGLFQAVMKNPPKKVVPDTYANLAFEPAGAHAIEGANMFKFGEYNYLFYSNGACCGFDKKRPAAGTEYKIKVCRSKSGVMDFRDATGKSCTDGGGTIVLESHGNVYGPGGQGVYDDPTHGPVLYYHYVNTKIGYADGQKQFGWNKLDFSNGWPVAK